MKAINYKMKKLNRFVYSSKGSPRDLKLSRTGLALQKNVKYDKNQNKLFFFVKNPGRSQ